MLSGFDLPTDLPNFAETLADRIAQVRDERTQVGQDILAITGGSLVTVGIMLAVAGCGCLAAHRFMTREG